MKKLTMFVLRFCPYCQEALRWQEELFREEPCFRDIPLEVIDEGLHPLEAKKWDYYYVPTYFCGAEKLHEGAATKEKVRAVFEAALK